MLRWSITVVKRGLEGGQYFFIQLGLRIGIRHKHLPLSDHMIKNITMPGVHALIPWQNGVHLTSGFSTTFCMNESNSVGPMSICLCETLSNSMQTGTLRWCWCRCDVIPLPQTFLAEKTPIITSIKTTHPTTSSKVDCNTFREYITDVYVSSGDDVGCGLNCIDLPQNPKGSKNPMPLKSGPMRMMMLKTVRIIRSHPLWSNMSSGNNVISKDEAQPDGSILRTVTEYTTNSKGQKVKVGRKMQMWSCSHRGERSSERSKYTRNRSKSTER